MKTLSFLLIAVLLAFTSSAQRRLPVINLKAINGTTVSSNYFIDSTKPTVISFWATWCVPCRQELDAIAEDWENFKSSGARFFAVAIDDSRSKATIPSLIRANGWEFAIFMDDNQELKQALNIDEIPHTIVIDKNGQIIKRFKGYNPGQEQGLITFLKSLNK